MIKKLSVLLMFLSGSAALANDPPSVSIRADYYYTGGGQNSGPPVGPPSLNGQGGTNIDLSGLFTREDPRTRIALDSQQQHVDRGKREAEAAHNRVEEIKRTILETRASPTPNLQVPPRDSKDAFDLSKIKAPTLDYHFKTSGGKRDELIGEYLELQRVRFTRFKAEKKASEDAFKKADEAFANGDNESGAFYQEIANELKWKIINRNGDLSPVAQTYAEIYGGQTQSEFVYGAAPEGQEGFREQLIELDNRFHKVDDSMVSNVERFLFRHIGIQVTREAELTYRTDYKTGDYLKIVASELLDLVTTLEPVTDVTDSLYKLYTNHDFFGREITHEERYGAYFTMLTFGGAKKFQRAGEAMWKVYKGAEKILKHQKDGLRLFNQTEKFLEKAKNTLREIESKHTITHFEKGADANERLRLLKKADEPPYIPESYVTHFTLEEKQKYVRFVGSDDKMIGRWMVKLGSAKNLSPTELQNKYNLPKTPKYSVIVQPESGTKMSRGMTNFNDWPDTIELSGIDGQVQFRIESDKIDPKWYTEFKEIGEKFIHE